MFKWINGLCQFVFASENEHYYLESLIRVSLRQYLYIQLKKAGYSNVFFLINNNGKGCELLIPDKDSADLYDSYRVKKSFFDKIWGSNEENATGKNVKIDDMNQFAKYMLQMMKNEKGIAFVFTTETFDLFSTNGDFIRELAEFSRISNGRKHLILNCISTEDTGSLAYLTKEEGIFRSILFEDIMWIFNQYRNPHVYDLMKEYMVGKVNHLNELSHSRIRSMMAHYLIGRTHLLSKYLSYIDDYSLMIYTWYCSRAFRKESAELLEQNLFPEIWKTGPVLLVDIEKNINDNRFAQLEKLRVKLLEQNPEKELRKVLFDYHNDTEFGIVEDNTNRSWIQMIDKMLLAEENNEETRDILYQIRGELKKTRAFRISKESKDYIESLNRDILEASNAGDKRTFRKGVEALQFGVSKWYAQTLEYEELNKDSDTYKCFEMYSSIMDASKKLFSMKQLYEEDTKRVDEIKREYMRLRQNALDFMKQNPQAENLANQVVAGMLKETPAMVKELLSRQTMAKNCYDNGKILSLERSNKHEKMGFLQNAIQQMEITLSGMKQECVAQQIRDLERTTSKVQELFVKDNELRKQIQQVSTKFEKTVEVVHDLLGEDVVPVEIDWGQTDKEIMKL